MDDGSVHVVDYKTATLSKKQREIMPLYEAQVSVYAYIAKRVGRRVPGPVRDLTLVYLEPRPDYDDERKLAMRFAVKAVAVPNHAEQLVPELLARAREIMEAETCPRHLDGCAELEKMDRLLRGADGGPVRGDVRALPQGQLRALRRAASARTGQPGVLLVPRDGGLVMWPRADATEESIPLLHDTRNPTLHTFYCGIQEVVIFVQ